MSHDPVTYLYESWQVVKVHLSIESDSSVLEVQRSQVVLDSSLEAAGQVLMVKVENGFILILNGFSVNTSLNHR